MPLLGRRTSKVAPANSCPCKTQGTSLSSQPRKKGKDNGIDVFVPLGGYKNPLHNTEGGGKSNRRKNTRRKNTRRKNTSIKTNNKRKTNNNRKTIRRRSTIKRKSSKRLSRKTR
tara:strand:- start:121 stop:462 length:342 start_codon:yes stop_codon:yes gene_type:complete